MPNLQRLRLSCYECPYATTERKTDMTIGDFWHIEETIPDFYDEKGNSIFLIHTDRGVVFFIAGIFVQKQLDVASVNGYAGFWKLYYMIWGKTIKNGVFMGMFYCMLGTLIQKIPQTKTVFICTISAFILYVVGVYFQYEWRKLLLPVVSVLVVESVIMLPLHIGSLGKWFRSMSTLLFLCHYIFVRAFECFPTLAVCFPEGIHKFTFVGVSAFLLSALLVWAGNKNKRIRWLWQ